MYSFSYLKPFCCSMSSSNCCFLTCIRISLEADQVVWYSHLFQNFPRFIVIHTVKGFGIVNKAEIDVFLELSCFFSDPADVAIWSLVALPFLKPAWTSGSSCLNRWQYTLFLLKASPLLPIFSSSRSQCGPLTSSMHSLALSQTCWTKLWPGAVILLDQPSSWFWSRPASEHQSASEFHLLKNCTTTPGFLPYSHDRQVPPGTRSLFFPSSICFWPY